MDHVQDGAVPLETFVKALTVVVGADLPWRELLPDLGVKSSTVAFSKCLDVLQVCGAERKEMREG